MKVNSSRDIPFKSIYTNNALKKSFEFAADNGALGAGVHRPQPQTRLEQSALLRSVEAALGH